ncbi:MAG: esterase-like activity of phytase family protein [Gammaproteobacteria bacterium]
MGIRLRGTLRLKAVDDGRPHQLSGLAWDADERLLYAVSDDGYLVHLRPHFSDGLLSGASLVAIHPLLDRDRVPLAGRLADPEGLAARRERNGRRGDTELAVAFEGVPRLERYDPVGNWLGTIALPAELGRSSNYAHPNRQLESVTPTPAFGYVVAPERPLGSRTQRTIPLYGTGGMRWHYPLADAAHGALVGMETLPGGDLLLLERRYVSPLLPLLIHVRRAALPPDYGAELVVTDVAAFSTAAGWALDNFEGIARHAGSCFFLVSDDNRSAFQRTLLAYFELSGEAGAAECAR